MVQKYMRGFITRREWDLGRRRGLLGENLIFFASIRTRAETDVQILIAWAWRRHRKRKQKKQAALPRVKQEKERASKQQRGSKHGSSVLSG